MKKLLLLTITALFIAQTSCSLTERLEAAEVEIATAKNNLEAVDAKCKNCSKDCKASCGGKW